VAFACRWCRTLNGLGYCYYVVFCSQWPDANVRSLGIQCQGSLNPMGKVRVFTFSQAIKAHMQICLNRSKKLYPKLSTSAVAYSLARELDCISIIISGSFPYRVIFSFFSWSTIHLIHLRFHMTTGFHYNWLGLMKP
jgi:hypothetical protein